MKKAVLSFLHRGLMTACGGPVILAVVYWALERQGVIQSLTPGEVSTGIFSVTLMAFIAGGITVVYTMERLPLITAKLIHGGALYLDYLIFYLLNNWLPRNHTGILTFTAIFVGGYAIVWVCVYLSIKTKTESINKKLRGGTI